MKRTCYLSLLLIMCSLGVLLGGCVIKPAPVPTRHFVLAPIPAHEHAPTITQPLAVEVGFVKMPSYLLRDSMVIRKSADEVEYLETALWAERLDHCFRQTLAENLSQLLAADRTYVARVECDRMVVRVSVNVDQFEVDTAGRGTLLASWRLIAGGADKPMKIGQARLARTGASPRGKPEVIATTLSDLAAEFSRELAPSIRESARSDP